MASATENPLMKSAPLVHGTRKNPVAAAHVATSEFAANDSTSPRDGLVLPGKDPWSVAHQSPNRTIAGTATHQRRKRSPAERSASAVRAAAANARPSGCEPRAM